MMYYPYFRYLLYYPFDILYNLFVRHYLGNYPQGTRFDRSQHLLHLSYNP